MPITKLGSETVKLLKSTQVVTNIWSIVKELVENALDANAKCVEIYLIENGLSLIKIRDDGTGICKEDAALMGLASHTSKITQTKDFDNLTTYGFRGVALHSICTLADVSVTTKTVGDEIATIYKLDHDGKIKETSYTHGNIGTTVEVRDFCKNFPVRRKSLSEAKQIKKDMKNVEILIKDFGICNPEVKFILKINTNGVFTKSSAKNLKQALNNVIGYKNVLSLHQIDENFSGTEIALMVPKKDCTNLTELSKSGQSYIFINKRPVKHEEFKQIATKKIVEYFNSKQQNIKKALFVLNMTVNPAEVDVNLEPNKDKVLLHKTNEIVEMLDKILSEYYELQVSEKEDNKENNENDTEKTVDSSEWSACDEEVYKEENIASACVGMEVSNKENNDRNHVQILEKQMKPLVLSESDSDGETRTSRRKSKSPSMSTIQESAASKIIAYYGYDPGAEDLSQIPNVDLGEDFGLEDLQKSKNENTKSVEVGSDDWSRGHIPAGTGVDVEVPVKFAEPQVNKKTAFQLFMSKQRSQIMSENPSAKEPEIAKIITDKWKKEISHEERGYFHDLAKEQNFSQSQSQKSKKRALEDSDSGNNQKIRKFLENKKRETLSEVPKNLVKKTIMRWEISLEDVLKNFQTGMQIKKEDEFSIIGPASDEKCWFIKHNDGIWMLNVPQLFQDLNLEVCLPQVNPSILKPILEKRLSRNSDVSNIMHHILVL